MPFPFLAVATALAPMIGGAIQSAHNKRLKRMENRFNSPVEQMNRFRRAGLNPNLVYTQGTSGNMTPITPTNWQDAIGNAPARYTMSELQQTQADVGEQKIAESKTKQGLMQAQTDLVKANPNLDPIMVAAARKQAEALAGIADNKFNWESTMENYQTGPNEVTIMPRGLKKFLSEIDVIDQKWRLNEADLKMKAEIFKSQEFKNYLDSLIRTYIDGGEVNGDAVRFFTTVLFNKFG